MTDIPQFVAIQMQNDKWLSMTAMDFVFFVQLSYIFSIVLAPYHLHVMSAYPMGFTLNLLCHMVFCPNKGKQSLLWMDMSGSRQVLSVILSVIFLAFFFIITWFTFGSWVLQWNVYSLISFKWQHSKTELGTKPSFR
jgi:hypothetical protein